MHTAAESVAAGVTAANVAGTMGSSEGTIVFANPTLNSTVIQEKLNRTTEESTKDFCKEWDRAVKEPINAISERFGHLKAGNHYIKVAERVSGDKVEKLHENLRNIESNYTSDIRLKQDLRKIPKLEQYLGKHAVLTPYSLSLQKCGDFRTPVEHQALALQRQPIPRKDLSRDGHFLCRDEALLQCGNDPKAWTDLTDLPYNVGDVEKGELKKRVDRDKKLNEKKLS